MQPTNQIPRHTIFTYRKLTHIVVLTQSGAGKGKEPFSIASLTAASPAHGHRAMLHHGNFFNMKAPTVVSACQPDVDFDHLIQ